uniref:Uncharacterized protein n=1 Tax=Picea sitchensis TaxID=3332 RepID=A9P2B0_PICSI|nr:unknown [Picea sitchensis]
MSGVIYNSSGSEHQPDSVCLGDMLAVFMEDESAPAQSLERLSPQHETMDANISEDCQSVLQSEENQLEILKGCISCTCPAELDLLAETAQCLEMARKLQQQQQPEFLKQSVMCHLRNVGYDAAICKSHPKDNSRSCRSFPSGNYEYMDVIMKSTNSRRSIRLIVDLDFKAQFEIARPTREYSTLLGLLPKIYVGRDHRLQSIVKIMCEGVKNSLKKIGMHLPPWRKYKYMHSMWLGSYKRTAACNSLQDGHDSNMTSTETSPITELMDISHLEHEVKRIKHFWNTIHAAGHVDAAEEYLNWGSRAGGIILSKPSTGKLNISTLARALMEAGLTSLSTTVEPERLCLPEALIEVAIALTEVA